MPHPPLVVMLAGLLIVAPTLTSAAPAAAPVYTLSGAWTGDTYAPALISRHGGGLTEVPGEPGGHCAFGDCTPIPAGEWLKLRVEHEPGKAVSVRVCHGDCIDGTALWLVAGPDGAAHAYLPPARPGQGTLRISFTPEGHRGETHEFVVEGHVPPDPREFRISPRDQWVSLEIERLLNADLTYYVSLDWSAYLGPSPTRHRAEAVVLDHAVQLGESRRAATFFDMWSADADVRVEAAGASASGHIALEEGLGIRRDGRMIHLTADAPAFLATTRLAASGYALQGPEILVFSPVHDAYRVRLDATGPFHLRVAEAGGNATTVSALTLGPHVGTYTTSGSIAGTGVVLAGFGTTHTSTTTADVAFSRDAGELRRTLAPGQSWLVGRAGDCTGEWSIQYATKGAVESFTAALAIAPGLELSALGNRTLLTGPDCALGGSS